MGLIDDLRVQQIIINLLSNALKFSQKKSTIVIKLEKIESKNDDERTIYDIKVIDKGIGMSQEDIDNLFTPYF